jgi:hypothetical protein
LVSTLLLFSPSSTSIYVGYLISFCFVSKDNLRGMGQPTATKQRVVPRNNRDCIAKARYALYFDRQTIQYLK